MLATAYSGAPAPGSHRLPYPGRCAAYGPVRQTVKRNTSGMSVRLTLICHASTSAVRNAAFPLDEALDPQGQAKASALVANLRAADSALTSPALRARQTAAALNLDAKV